MIAFSIRQPWAWLIVNGFKDVENRDWKPSNPALRFRGRALIHAGLKLEEEAAAIVRRNIHPVTGEERNFGAPEKFDLGGIVGAATFYDVVDAHESDWFVGPVGLLVRDAVACPFVVCPGQLGFFKIPDNASTALSAAIRQSSEG